MRSITIGLLILLVAGCNRQPGPSKDTPPDSATPHRPGFPPTVEKLSGGGVGYKDFWISGGNRYRDGNGPGILYGTITPPNGQPQLIYVGLFKYPGKYNRFGGASNGGTTSAGDGNVTIVDGLSVNDQEITIRVEMFADAAAGKVTREELHVASEKLDPSKGRLLLMDFTADKARWKQVDVDLSKALTGIDLKDAEAMGKKGVAQIRQATPAVDEFFK